MNNNLASRFTLHASRFIFSRAACSLQRVACYLFSFAFILSPLMCFAQSVSSIELINNAKLYDGKIVTYEGEVIGDIMIRGDYGWLNVHDKENAIGIWTDKNLAKDILYTGSYKSKGDWLEITGVFQRACLQHGGDLDVHAQAIRKVRQGRQTIEKLNMSKRNLAFVLLGVLCLVWILKLLKLKSIPKSGI